MKKLWLILMLGLAPLLYGQGGETTVIRGGASLPTVCKGSDVYMKAGAFYINTATSPGACTWSAGTSASTPFSGLTGGTNTSAAMVVGSGASFSCISGSTCAFLTQAQNNNSTAPATTAYTDLAVANAVAGVNPAIAVLVATTSASDTSGLTYANGVSGVGATFTGANNTAITIDGVTFTAVGQRLLVKNDTQSPSGAFNGIYSLTALQTAGTGAVFTRATDYDTPSNMNSTGAIPVQSGTANTTTSWLMTAQIVTVGTTPLTFAQFSYSPTALVTSLTSPLVKTGNVGSCPTCVTGPNQSIIGGIVGGLVTNNTVGIAAGNFYGWFSAASVGPATAFGSDLWLSGLTVYLDTAMGTGGQYTLSLQNFNGATLEFSNPFLLSIPNNAAIGVFQSPVTEPIFVPTGVYGAMNTGGFSPANAVVGSLDGFSANVVGAAVQPLGVGLGGNSVVGSTTVYTGFSQGTSTTNTTEALDFDVAPYAFTASNLCISLKGAAPSGGTFTATLRKATSGGSYAPADTALVATVVASGGIGTYCDTTDTVAFAATDTFDVKLVNGSGSTGPTLYGLSMMTTVPNGSTGMIVWGFGGSTFPNNSTKYFPPFSVVAGSGTEALDEAPMPRALSMSNLSCYVTTAPLTSTNALTVRQNAGNPSSGLTVTLALATTGVIQDVAHTISFANKDLFDIASTQASGTAPAVSSCSTAVN